MGEKTIIKIGGMTGTLCAQTIAKALSKDQSYVLYPITQGGQWSFTMRVL